MVNVSEDFLLEWRYTNLQLQLHKWRFFPGYLPSFILACLPRKFFPLLSSSCLSFLHSNIFLSYSFVLPCLSLFLASSFRSFLYFLRANASHFLLSFSCIPSSSFTLVLSYLPFLLFNSSFTFLLSYLSPDLHSFSPSSFLRFLLSHLPPFLDSFPRFLSYYIFPFFPFHVFLLRPSYCRALLFAIP